MSGKTLLTLVAALNFGIALLHLVIIVVGVPGYLYFGAAELAITASQGSPMPALVTFGLTLIFAGFGLYALSGAGVIRRLPLLTVGLIFIFTLWLMWRAYADLGRNWSPKIEIGEGQKLVTDGVYRYIRHPIYAGM